jgi:hypothetical protein
LRRITKVIFPDGEVREYSCCASDVVIALNITMDKMSGKNFIVLLPKK